VINASGYLFNRTHFMMKGAYNSTFTIIIALKYKPLNLLIYLNGTNIALSTAGDGVEECLLRRP
jgi:hypothetical protein